MLNHIRFIILIAALSAFCFKAPVAAQEKNGWQTIKATHFVVYYRNAEDDLLNDLIEKAEDDYNKIADNLGFRRFDFWLWDNRAKIYIYDDAKSYRAATGQPDWSAGCAMTREKVIKTYVGASSFFTAVLPHELGHIIFREFVGFDNPAVTLWLDEGVACLQEKFRHLSARNIVNTALKKNNLMSIEALDGFNPAACSDDRKVNLFYAQSLNIVDYLVKEFGSDNFVSFCQNLRDKKNLEAALSSSYPFENLREMEKAWLEYLED